MSASNSAQKGLAAERKSTFDENPLCTCLEVQYISPEYANRMKAVSETTNTHADITCLDLNNFPIKIMNRQSRTVFRCLRQFLCVILYVLLTKEYDVFFFFKKVKQAVLVVVCKSVSVQKLLHFAVGQVSLSRNEHLSESASNFKIF